MGFQQSVNTFPALAVEGDWASANPRASMIAGDSALVASAAGVRVGAFAFASNLNGRVSSAHPGVPSRVGFVNRTQPVVITGWLEGDSMLLTSGLEVVLTVKGDVFARFADGAGIGDAVYASYADGSVVADAAGATIPGASFTGVIAVTTGILTASVVTGDIVAGQPIAGTDVPAGTIVTGQLTGTPGGAGTYSTNIVTAVASTDMTTAGAVATGWTVQSTAAVGELAKISA